VLEIDGIIRQILENCDISDSESAGLYSVCGLALRLRDLYKWEKGLPPWEERDSREILAWIGDKEVEWERLANEDFMKLSVGDETFDPFDTLGINRILEPEGLLYGAGYGRSLKPTFFLARIVEKTKVNGHRVYTLGSELARDLFTIPALTQDNHVIVRKQTAMLFLWDQITYIKESGRHALRFAFKNCGIQEGGARQLKYGLATIFNAQKDTYVYHEIGEILDTAFDPHVWREVIATYPHTPVELLARAVKDLLADTNESGTLRHIIKERRAAALGFYVAFFDGLAQEILPELRGAFRNFAETGDWQIIKEVVSTGHKRAAEYARFIVDTHEEGKKKSAPEWARAEIERHLLKGEKAVVR
jgi:hypothetical protein